MLLFRFITRQPWIFSMFGLMMLALTMYSVWDVQRGGNVVPFEQLEVYSGKVVAVNRLGESVLTEPDGQNTPFYYEELTVLQSSGEERQCRFLLHELLPVGTYVTVHEGEKNKVYNLVADGRLLVDYEAIAAHAAKRAQDAKETMTQPRVLGLAGVLIFGGMFAQIRQMRKRARYRQELKKQGQEEISS